MTRTRILALSSVALLAALAFAPSVAQAGGRHRPMYAGFGGGPYFFLDGYNAHVHLTGEVGFHFNGEDRGFFLQIEAQTTFATNAWVQFIGGLRLGGDIELKGNWESGIILRPNVFFGFGFGVLSSPNSTWGLGVIEPTCDLRFVVADRLLAIWLRPVSFQFLFYFDRSFAVAYAPMVGLDFQF